jgi:hypothetical protein
MTEMRGQPEDLGYATPPRPRRAQPPDSIQSLLEVIDDRLSAIERHLGIIRPAPDTGPENVVPPS